jgi:hypothetical protein
MAPKRAIQNGAWVNCWNQIICLFVIPAKKAGFFLKKD